MKKNTEHEIPILNQLRERVRLYCNKGRQMEYQRGSWIKIVQCDKIDEQNEVMTSKSFRFRSGWEGIFMTYFTNSDISNWKLNPQNVSYRSIF